MLHSNLVEICFVFENYVLLKSLFLVNVLLNEDVVINLIYNGGKIDYDGFMRLKFLT